MEIYAGKQFISRQELYSNGYSAYKIRKLVGQGKLLQLNQNQFENPDFVNDANELNYVSKLVPRGVVCLIRAAIYHELTTYMPLKIDVAIPRNCRVPKLPVWPKIQPFLFSEERYQLGIMTVNCEGGFFRIYDAEKTVCDMLFYRNKLGLEPSIEVLKNYLNRKNRNINRLTQYAEKLRCSKLLQVYLEVLL